MRAFALYVVVWSGTWLWGLLRRSIVVL